GEAAGALSGSVPHRDSDASARALGRQESAADGARAQIGLERHFWQKEPQAAAGLHELFPFGRDEHRASRDLRPDLDDRDLSVAAGAIGAASAAYCACSSCRW